MINAYELVLFIPEGEKGLYRKYEEVHYQRAYSLETIKKLIKEAGLIFEDAYDAFTRNPPAPDSERICIVAREHGKRIEE